MAVIPYKAKKVLRTSSGNRNYSFEFDYINRHFVKAYLDGVLAPCVVQGHTLTLDTAPKGNQYLIIVRETPTEQLVRWADSSIFLARDMNLEALQILHIVEETYDKVKDIGFSIDLKDGKITANNKPLKGLADPTADDEAISKKYLDTATTAMQARLQETIQSITQKLQEVQGAINSQSQSLQSSLSSRMDTVERQTQEGIQEAKESVKQSLQEAERTVINRAESTLGNIQGDMRSLQTELKGNMTTLQSELKGNMASLTEELKGSMAQVTSGANQTMQETKTNLEGRMTSLEGNLNSRMGSIENVTNTKLEQYRTEIQGKIDTANTLLSNLSDVDRRFEENKRYVDSRIQEVGIGAFEQRIIALENRPAPNIDTSTLLTKEEAQRTYYTKNQAVQLFNRISRLEQKPDIDISAFVTMTRYERDNQTLTQQTQQDAQSRVDTLKTWATDTLLSKTVAHQTYQTKGIYATTNEVQDLKRTVDGVSTLPQRITNLEQRPIPYTKQESDIKYATKEELGSNASSVVWKQAFTGKHTSTGTPICTLPQEAKECVVVFTGTENNNDVEFHANILLAPDRKNRDTYYHFASIIPRTRHNDYMWLRVLISSRRQVSLYNTSVSGLMFVSRVYWR